MLHQLPFAKSFLYQVKKYSKVMISKLIQQQHCTLSSVFILTKTLLIRILFFQTLSERKEILKIGS